jgi:hypothetical protein
MYKVPYNKICKCIYYILFIVIVNSSIIIIIVSLSGQAVLLRVTDCEPLEEQESGGHPRMDVFLNRRVWLR